MESSSAVALRSVRSRPGRSASSSRSGFLTATSGKFITGSDKKGFFVAPTVIETSDPKSVTMVEEIFGPVLTVSPWPRLDRSARLGC